MENILFKTNPSNLKKPNPGFSHQKELNPKQHNKINKNNISNENTFENLENLRRKKEMELNFIIQMRTKANESYTNNNVSFYF